MTSTGRTRAWRLPGLLPCLGLTLAYAPARFDLDVAVPPGSPLEWSGSFPAYTPGRRPLFPRTGEAAPDPGRSLGGAAGQPALAPDARFGNSFGLVRVLTWDIAGHLEWIAGRPATGPRSGPVLSAPPPRYGDALYWLALVPLLRILLHPDALSPTETLGHLVELGEPVLVVLEAAAGEENLKAPCAELRRLIPASTPAQPAPPTEADARTRMLARFVHEECLREHPHDPTGSFGKRLFLFADEVEPLLERQALSATPGAARAAVAALGRYRTPHAARVLAQIAAESEEPVVLVRALAALDGWRGGLDPAPLVARLERLREPVLRAALIGALGRLGARGALPTLLALGREALAAHDSDHLITLLSALARIPPGDAALREGVRSLAEDVAEAAREQPELFRPAGPRPNVRADVPDPPRTRAQILEQLALLVRWQCAPADEKLVAELLELPRPAPADPRLTDGRPATDPLAGIHAPVRGLYLESLARLGAPGAARLVLLARERGLESSLRAAALQLVPWPERESLALELYAAESEPAELRIAAFELYLLDAPARAQELARTLLTRAAGWPPGGGDPTERFLCARAVRFLGEAAPERIAAAELLPLVPQLLSSPATRLGLAAELTGLLQELVRRASEGAGGRALSSEVRATVDFVLGNGIGPHREGARAALEQQLLQSVANARAHRSEQGYQESLVARLRAHLLGEPSVTAPAQPGEKAGFLPPVPLEEELLLALGRTRTSEAAEVLVQLLGDRKSDLRAWTALALGMCAQPATAPALLPLLLDAEPFVRFCAYESLRRLSGKDVAIDWMYGPSAERFDAAEEYRRWSLAR